MEEKIMTGKTILKALLNGVASWLIIALVFHCTHGTTFAEELFSTYVMAISGCAAVASLRGFILKEMREQNY